MAVEWISLGAAVTRLALRAGSHGDAADAVGDGEAGWRAVVRGATRRSEEAMRPEIARRLGQRLAGLPDDSDRAEVAAAAANVEALITRLADTPDAVIAAATNPDGFLKYAMQHGGDDLLATTGEVASQFFLTILAAATDEYVRLAPSSAHFAPAALVSILASLRRLETDRPELVALDRLEGVLREVAKRQGAEGILDAAWEATKSGRTMGCPVTECDPSALGVHSAIQVGPEPHFLTNYILRPHDIELRNILSRASVPGTGASFVVVSGESCTGKTRSLFEAVSAVLPAWNLVQPARHSSELRSVLAEGVPERTVLWLDELKDHVNASPEGIQSARYLLELLRGRAPSIVVAATSWTSDLRALAQRPMGEFVQLGYAAVSDLLQEYGERVDQPSAFDLELVRSVQTHDPRVQEALATAHRGEVIQVLSGGRVLERALRGDAAVYGPEAMAVLRTALEARRMGLPNPVPGWLIEASAHQFLDPSLYASVSPDWLSQGTQGACVVSRGVRALTPAEAAAPGRPTGFDVHDYLFQQYLSTSRFKPTHRSLWDALTDAQALDRIQEAHLSILSESARQRGLYTSALILGRHAASRGGTGDDRHRLAYLLAWFARRGDASALAELTELAKQEANFLARHESAQLAGTSLKPRRLSKVEELGRRARSGDDVAHEQVRRLAGSHAHARRVYCDLLADRVRNGDEDALSELRTYGGDGRGRTVLMSVLATRARRGDDAALDEIRGLKDNSPRRNVFFQVLAERARMGDHRALAELQEAAGSDRLAHKHLRDLESDRRPRDLPEPTPEEASLSIYEDRLAADLAVLSRQGDEAAWTSLSELSARSVRAKRLWVEILIERAKARDVAAWQELQGLAAERYGHAERALANLLADRIEAGDPEAEIELRALATRNKTARDRLARQLAARAVSGDESAMTELRSIADDERTLSTLSGALATRVRRGEPRALGELARLALSGSRSAQSELSGLLRVQAGRGDERAFRALVALVHSGAERSARALMQHYSATADGLDVLELDVAGGPVFVAVSD